LLTRQQRQKEFYDRGTRPLSRLHEGEPVRMKRGREWTPAVVLKQYQAPRSYIMTTPDGTQMRRNRFHLQPTKEEASPPPCPHWKAEASDESNPGTQPNTDAGIEVPEMESHPNVPQEEQPARRSLLSSYYKFNLKEHLGDLVGVHTQNLMGRQRTLFTCWNLVYFSKLF